MQKTWRKRIEDQLRDQTGPGNARQPDIEDNGKFGGKRGRIEILGKRKITTKEIAGGGHIGKAQPHHHVDIEPKLKAKT